MVTIEDRNGKDLIEAEEITKDTEKIHRRRYTIEIHKQDLNDPDHHDAVVTYPEPHILKCEVKWALGSTAFNKAHRGDGIPAELFQSLKNDATKVLDSICQKIWKTKQ